MRIHPEKTQDEEFELLGLDGYDGALNERQYDWLKNLSYDGSLSDMFFQLNQDYEVLYTSGGKVVFTSDANTVRVQT